MKNTHLNEDLLWDYADGLLDAPEKAALENQLLNAPEWQQTLDGIMALKAQLHATPLDKPRRDFSDRVMAAWADEKMTAFKPDKGKDWIVYLISALFGVFILVPFIMLIGQLSTLSFGSGTPLELPEFDVTRWADSLNLGSAMLAGLMILCLLTVLFLDRFLRHRQFLASLTKR
jgi:anti-sigma factor RsiW